MLRYVVVCMMLCAAPAWAAEDRPLSELTPYGIIACKTKEDALRYAAVRDKVATQEAALNEVAVPNTRGYCTRELVLLDESSFKEEATIEGTQFVYKIVQVTLLAVATQHGTRKFVTPLKYFLVASKRIIKA